MMTKTAAHSIPPMTRNKGRNNRYRLRVMEAIAKKLFHLSRSAIKSIVSFDCYDERFDRDVVQGSDGLAFLMNTVQGEILQDERGRAGCAARSSKRPQDHGKPRKRYLDSRMNLEYFTTL